MDIASAHAEKSMMSDILAAFATGEAYIGLIGWKTFYLRHWRIIIMEFIETPTFTKAILRLMPDDDYRLLQNLLIADPARGDMLRGGGGIRKLRFVRPGMGKRGGVRVIYYWVSQADQVYMLLAYAKAVKEDLTAAETALLRELVKEL